MNSYVGVVFPELVL